MKIHCSLFLATVLGALAAVSGSRAIELSRREHGEHERPINHVFIIVLENEGFNKTFGPTSEAPYLSKELTKKGVLLAQYFGTSHASLGNYVAMISGQAATPETRSNCQVFADFVMTGTTPDGQAIGSGCVYPREVKTLADQLSTKGRTWRGYMEDMGNDATREAATCGHPTLNASDPTQSAEKPSTAAPLGDQYAARHNPFVYFHSIIDSRACASNVVNLKVLPNDLKSSRSTPNFAFITPNLCNDGHDEPCKNGQPGGLVSADSFLRKWVPLILASPAYRKDGLLIITFDEGDATAVQNPGGGHSINFAGSYCCSEQPGPNIGAFPQSATIGSYTLNFQDFGGDRIGAVLLSPLLRPGTVANTPFNHFSLLKTLEDIFDTDEYLGYAAQPGLVGFFDCTTSVIDPLTRDRLFGHCTAP